MALLFGSNAAMAADWTPAAGNTYILRTTTGNKFSVDGAGEYDGIGATTFASGTTTIQFATSAPVYLHGRLTINGSAVLNLELYDDGGTDKYTSSITMIVDNFTSTNEYSGYILLAPTSGNAAHSAAMQLNITGFEPDVEDPTTDTATFASGRQFVIDGASTINTPTQGATEYEFTSSFSGRQGINPFIRINGGTATLTNVTLQNHWNQTNAQAGAIFVHGGKNETADWTNKLNMTHCLVQKCACTYPGIAMQAECPNSENVKMTLNRCKFYHMVSTNANNASIGGNGAVRSVSNSTCKMEINNCTFTNNYGGGIRNQAVRAGKAIIRYCLITNNVNCGYNLNDFSDGSGGGILVKASAEITGCKIINNKARKSGGGVYFCPFEEKKTFQVSPLHGEITLDATTIIKNNKAQENGGGLSMEAFYMETDPHYYGFSNAEPPVQDGQYRMTLNLEGATIEENEAVTGAGGGIYISRPKDSKGIIASFYSLTCNLKHGTIKKNTAATNGGGVAVVALDEISNPEGMPNTIQPQDVMVTLNTESGTNNMLIQENTAQNGAGVYVEAYEIEYNGRKSNVYTKVFNDTEIVSNAASQHGGGLYVEKGTVIFTGQASGYQPNIHANTSVLNGGGMYLNNGKIETTYCDIQDNETTTANGSGGGIYLYQGNIDIRNSNVNNNKSKKNGGGIYCEASGGTSKIEFANSKLRGNRSDEHGGGIYINSGTIDIKGGSQIGAASGWSNSNTAGTKAEGTNTAYGGGIYTQTGVVNIENSTIGRNVATSKGGGIYTKTGTVTIIGSTITYNYAGYKKTSGSSSPTANDAQGTGGGIHTDGGLVIVNPNENETKQTKITNNRARLNGGGIFTGKVTEGGVTYKGKVEIYGNHEAFGGTAVTISNNQAVKGSGGGIFCYGDPDNMGVKERYILLRRVTLSSNSAPTGDGNQPSEYTGITSGCGGGIYLQDGLIDMNLCKVDKNTAILNGGGINNHSGNINVLGCKITNNEAGKGNNNKKGSGGGIYTHSGTIGINYWGEPATLQNESDTTHIIGNTANLNGGGLNTHKGKIFAIANSKESSDRIIISGNTATLGSGGAIFCMGEDGGSSTTTFIELKHVDLKNNKALEGEGFYTEDGNTISKGCGGGVYLQLGEIDATDVIMQNNYAKQNGGAINNHNGFVDIWGCAIGGEAGYYDDNHETGDDLGNKAGNSGGGIYTNEGDIDIEDYIEHVNGSSHRFESYVKYNKAGQNGGGINTHSGTIYINRNERDHEIDIAYNTANKGGGIYANAGSIWAYNAHIDNNTATENGGGANNHAGDINIFGGTFYNNTATEGRGGGVFTYVGDVNIKPFPSTITNPTRNEGTRISNNLAKLNGGGINNHTGRVDARYASMRNNTATLGNGGGIFCEGPHDNSTGFTIRLLESELKENKTRGEDGTLEDPTGRGGGIYLKYGSIYAQNSNIIENFANINGGGLNNHDGVILAYGCDIKDNHARHGRGGGIYTQTGSITTGPSLYQSTTRSTLIQGNTAKINGGGINNHNGDIFINGDHILENIAETGHGGGIYINSGTIEMAGGKIANNEAKLGDGGGVWSGGGNFHIHRRQGKPIVEIVDVDVTGTGTATVHYHCIDGGSTALTTYGILYGKVEADVEAATGAGGTVSSQTGGTAGTETGCYRINLTSLESGTTYYVKAFATNSTPLTDYSNVGSFTTFDSKPYVISGTVAEITSTTAQGSGKLVKSNNDTLCGVVYIQKDGHLGSYDNLVLTTTGAQKVYEEGPHNDGYFYTLDMTGLTPGKKYFARAYASNANGTAYGDTVVFYTKKDVPILNGNVVDVTNITDKEAKFTFTIPACSRVIKTYGFVWSTDDDPSLNEDYAHIWKESTDAIPANTEKTISITIDTLHSATHYYVRAFASYEEFSSPMDHSDYALSVPTEFFTKDADGNPITRSIRLSGISQNGVTFTGMVIDKGSPATITEYGVCYSTSSNPTIADSKAYFTSDIDINTEYIKDITGLTINQTYYLRAYAINDDDKTGYGNEFTFTTLAAKIPRAYITQIDGITQTEAQVHVTVDSQGGGDITNWGVKYGTTENIDDPTTIDINKPGDDGSGILSGTTFEADLPKSGEAALVKNTNYYVWVYATNSIGTYTTSHWTKFRTDYDKPSITNVTVSEIAFNVNAPSTQQNSARFAATVTPTGSDIKTIGVCWSTNQEPKRMGSEYTDSQFEEARNNDGWSSAQSIDYAGNLQKYPNTKYYVRAYASLNEPDGDNKLEDIIYGNIKSFTTLPVVQTDGVSNITNTGATLTGTIVTPDKKGNLKQGYYGFCWNTSGDPTVEDNLIQERITNASTGSRIFSLTPTTSSGVTYYYRAYYKSKDGDIAYGEVGATTFTTKQYKVDVMAGTGGTVTPTVAYLDDNEQCSVEATPETGYDFASWSFTGGGTGPILSDATSSSTTFTMGNPGTNAVLTATFVKETYTITAGVTPEGAGTVTGAGSYEYGDNVTLTAIANSGYEFVYWTKGGEFFSDEESISFSATEHATYVANFAIPGGGKGNTSMNATPTPRPRDIYPAPASEPWDWDDDDFIVVSDTLTEGDTIADGEDKELQAVRERISRDPIVPVDVPQIIENKATEGRGGGIFLNRKDKEDPAYPKCDSAVLIFSDGKINYNYAKVSGGGIHIDTSAYMQMKGICEVNANRVNLGSLGGGIYQAGRLYVGEFLNDVESAHTLRVNKNFAIGTADNDGGLITNYKAIVAFSVSNKDLAKACNLTENVLTTRTLGSGTPSILTQLLLLANNITAETGIVAQDIVDALNLGDVSALEALTVEAYNAMKASMIANAAGALNNIYLPRDSYDFHDHQAYGTYDDHSSVIVVLSNLSAKNTITEANNVQYPYTNLGFSVPHGYCPVIATSDGFGNKYMNTQQITGQNPEFENLLNLLMPVGTLSLKDCAVFEDSDSYIAIHTRKNNDPFLGKYIYLWGSWTNPKVGEDPEIATGGIQLMGSDPSHKHYNITYIDNPLAPNVEAKKIAVWEILSEEGLSWFSSYVNGLNIFNPVEGGDEYHKKYDPQVNPYAKAKLMNDLDMRDALWVPIGSVTFYHGPSGDGGIYSDENIRSFKGEFDGQGHLVTGLDCRYLTGIENYGFFGRLAENAKVKNLFIDDSKFHTISNELGYCVGGVAGQMSGNAIVSASEARSEINVVESKKSGTYVGGIAGKVEKLTTDPAEAKVVIHSSMAMPNISGSAKYVGGLVGYLGSGNDLFNSFSNPKFPDAAYNDTICMSGQYAGDPPVWQVTNKEDIYFGGLVGVNNGTVENCYSRLQGSEPIGGISGTSIFGWLAGTNTGTIQYSYALQPSPEATRIYVRKTTSPGNNAPSGHGTYGPTTLYSGKYGFKHRDQHMTAVNTQAAIYISDKLNDTLIVGGLTNSLNAWVEAHNETTKTYHPWMRTMASPINDDYPIPNFLNPKKLSNSTVSPTELSDNDDPLWNAVGSIDKVFMIYDTDVNDLYHAKQLDTVKPAYHPHAAMYLYNTNGINSSVTEAVPVTITNNARVPLYIHEDVGITQPKDSVLTARVGVTFDNSNRSILPELGGQPYDWHMFSSALTSASMGLKYHTNETGYPGVDNYYILNNFNTLSTNGIPHDDYVKRINMDPPKTTWFKGNVCVDSVGYFPINTPYGTWRDQPAGENGSFDFYCYGEAYYQHWINFKREGRKGLYDHWRQDPIANGNHLNIPYPNETKMVNGRGYMMGVSQRSMLMADGTLNNEVSGDNGAITYNATFTVDPSATVYDALVRGTNLVGNPYQSFLDMNKFLSENSVGGIYYIFDADKADANGNLYLAYPQSGSYNPEYAPKILHPHQGFFVKVSSNNTPIKFTNEMRVAGKWTSSLAANDDLKGSYFRENVNYPLVNLSCFDSDGKRDLTTVEINRPELGGGLKMKRLHMGNAILYAHMEGGDYQALFAPEGISEVPVRFEAFEDDVFTMRWSTLHGNFHYLHLIDNMTGSDIDMLRATEYHFEGKTTDYKSRFKLVFEVTGLEEEDDNEDDNGSTINFAFRMGDEIVVNGEGYFELFDVQGRRLTAKHLAGAQSSVSLPNVAAGVYLLRLTSDKQVKTQKMVISY